MNPTEVAQRLGDRLEEAGLPYAIGGALALGVWGAPRMTKDVDLSIFAPDRFDEVSDALERAGMIFDRVAAPKTIDRIGMFNGKLAGLVVDVFVSRHPHMSEMERRRVRVDAQDGTHLYFITAEDLCVLKLLYGRPKDIGDLERLFATRAIDLGYVRRWLAMMPIDRTAILDSLVPLQP